MIRERLDQLSFAELKKKAVSYGLKPPANREKCIDQIMAHLEKTTAVNVFKTLPTVATVSMTKSVSCDSAVANKLSTPGLTGAVPRDSSRS